VGHDIANLNVLDSTSFEPRDPGIVRVLAALNAFAISWMRKLQAHTIPPRHYVGSVIFQALEPREDRLDGFLRQAAPKPSDSPVVRTRLATVAAFGNELR
jgi:hypothetical protein